MSLTTFGKLIQLDASKAFIQGMSPVMFVHFFVDRFGQGFTDRRDVENVS